MASANKQKGNALENAVTLIQRTILESDPKLAGTSFSIETNKIEVVSGTRHELDVLVKTHPSSPYECSWIFECKNWKQPVDKNEVIILAEKVRAVQANKGYLVARQFTKDAVNQAKTSERVELLHCADDFVSPFSFQLLHKVHLPDSVVVKIQQRGLPPSPNPAIADYKKINWHLNGRPIDFAAFINEHVDKMMASETPEDTAKYRNASSHKNEKYLQIIFEAGEFLMGDKEIEHLVIDVHYWTTVRPMKLISRFEVQGQGRVFSFEPCEEIAPGKKLKVDIVTLI